MRFTLWRRYASDVESLNDESEAASSESAAVCALSSSSGPPGQQQQKKRKVGNASSSSSSSLAAMSSRRRRVVQEEDEEESSEGEDRRRRFEKVTAGSVTRGARGLVARMNALEQSVDELKERLFFDGAEAAARFREFENLRNALDDVVDAIEEESLTTESIERVRASSRVVCDLWQTSDDLGDRLRKRCACYALRDPRSGFAADVGVSTVLDESSPLAGQKECVALKKIESGSLAPYPGVVVSSLEEQKALLAPLRPVDRVKWACFSYSFSSQENDGIFCTELWPTLDAPMTFVNDACGPSDRTAKKMADRQNVEYVESVSDENPMRWKVDVRATRDIYPGESLLSDYGDAYWQNWKEHVHTRAMKRLEQRVADVYAIRVQEDKRKKKNSTKKIRLETRVDAWLRQATLYYNNLHGIQIQDDLESSDDEEVEEIEAANGVPTRKSVPKPPPMASASKQQNDQRSSNGSGTKRAYGPRKKKAKRREGQPSWRDKIGRVVVVEDKSCTRGYESQPGVAMRVAVERDSFDPMLEALYETALGSPTMFEAWWSDGQTYPLLTVNPRPRSAAELWLNSKNKSSSSSSHFDVHFVDGERMTLDRVAPILKPNVWKKLERLPIGAWCTPVSDQKENGGDDDDDDDWGVVVSYSFSKDVFTYHVKLDNHRAPKPFEEDEIEPIVIVRGMSQAGRNGGNWQQAAPVSKLTDLGDPPTSTTLAAPASSTGKQAPEEEESTLGVAPRRRRRLTNPLE